MRGVLLLLLMLGCGPVPVPVDASVSCVAGEVRACLSARDELGFARCGVAGVWGACVEVTDGR